LSELFVENAQTFIVARGGIVRTNADVAEVVIRENGVNAVRLRDNSEIRCAAAIVTVPHYRIVDLLPSMAGGISSTMISVPNTPIVSIHLWFEEAFMRHEFVGLIGRRVQWIFNKNILEQEQDSQPTSGRGHVSCVISAGGDYINMSNDELVRIALDDLRSVYRAVPSSACHSVVIREKRATFSCTPVAERSRPAHVTSIPNLFLAGDWTNTGLPATIEGAILSGEKCARLVMERINNTGPRRRMKDTPASLKEFHP
jgi:zeta-carotene desaturase